MSNIIRWVLNWVSQHAAASIYTSRIPVGTRLGGHDIPQIADLYIIITFLIKQKPVFTGHFQAL